MDKPTPRINASMIQQHAGTTVRIVGRIVQAGTWSCVLEDEAHRALREAGGNACHAAYFTLTSQGGAFHVCVEKPLLQASCLLAGYNAEGGGGGGSTAFMDESSQGSGFILETSDGSTVLVNPTVECTYSANFIELLGKVQNDGSVSGYTAVDLSDNFDLKTYGLFERAAQKCPALFA
ncbi:hypothetical protein GGI01_000565 [Coemansia sp. RSA 376]|nr:hypothetical protein GGI01_000565 [Coemansia sp. RSA 376]